MDDPVQHALGNLAGVLMGDDPARRFLCARCRAPVLVCSHCDRGQIYCAKGCAATARQQRQRDAARRYQCSLRGRFKHAARTRRWRERQAARGMPTPMPAAISAAAAQSVTHQGSPAPALDAVLTIPSSMPAAAAPAPASPVQPCTTVTTISASTASTLSSSAAGHSTPMPTVVSSAWRCHWCRTPCPAGVRLEFLRRSRPARRGPRLEPSHGHSP